jgi:hypothetical protein
MALHELAFTGMDEVKKKRRFGGREDGYKYPSRASQKPPYQR